jgi:16S rRNA (cytosine967-C5)-methyltransferase
VSAQPREGFAPGASALASAAAALDEIMRNGCTAEESLLRVAPALTDRAAVRAIHTGTLRWFLLLAPAVDALLQPGQKMHSQVRALLICALHQVEFSRAVPASLVNIAVDAARVLNQGSASGFVNALLRRYLREHKVIMARVHRSAAAAVAHPRWLLRAIHAEHAADAERVIAANNESPPMCLRVNLTRTTREAVLAMLAEQGIAAAPGMVPSAIVLDEPMDVAALPGFEAGAVSVQDAGAQHAALLLDAQPGQRVLDACAAPGGKAGHILERTPDLALLVALDIDAQRLTRVEQNLTRLGLRAQLMQADVLAGGWWDGRPFDRILLDVPCSGAGVIRRHPDIKLLRRAEDIAGFARTQLALLTRCAALLAPGGRIVYATCSILAAENAEVVDLFLRKHPQFARAGDDLQLLPTPRSASAATLTDGFYYACLTSGEAGT